MEKKKTTNKETIIFSLTDEMKTKYLSLKKYKELIFLISDMNFKEAKEFAKKNNISLPNEVEAQEIFKLIRNNNFKGFFWLWTDKENKNSAVCIDIHNNIETADFEDKLSCVFVN